MHFSGISVGVLALLGLNAVQAATFQDLDANLVERVAIDMDQETYASFRQLCTQTASVCPSLKVIDKSKDVVKVVASMDALKRHQIRKLNREFERALGFDGGDPFAYVTLLADTIAQLENRIVERIEPGFDHRRTDALTVVMYSADHEGRWFPVNGYDVPPFGSQLSTRARAYVKIFKTYLRQRPAMEVVQNSEFWMDSLMHAVFGNLPWEVRLERLDAFHKHVNLAETRPFATKFASRVLFQKSLADLVGSYLMSDSYPLNRMPPSIELNGKKLAFVLRSTATEHDTESDEDTSEQADDESRYLHFEMVPLTTLEDERDEHEARLGSLPMVPAVKRFISLQRLLRLHRAQEDGIQTRERHYRAVTNPLLIPRFVQMAASIVGRFYVNIAVLSIAKRFNLKRLLVFPIENIITDGRIPIPDLIGSSLKNGLLRFGPAPLRELAHLFRIGKQLTRAGLGTWIVIQMHGLARRGKMLEEMEPHLNEIRERTRQILDEQSEK
jgi:hypothetical protein